MPRVDVRFFVFDPERGDHVELSVRLPERFAPYLVAGLFGGDGTTAVHGDDLRLCPELLEQPEPPLP